MSMFSNINKESMSLPGEEKYTALFGASKGWSRNWSSSLQFKFKTKSGFQVQGGAGRSQCLIYDLPQQWTHRWSVVSLSLGLATLWSRVRGNDSNNHQRRMSQRPSVGQSCLSLVGSLGSSSSSLLPHTRVWPIMNSAPMRAQQSSPLSCLWWVMLSKNIMCSSEQQIIQNIGSAKWCFAIIPD